MGKIEMSVLRLNPEWTVLFRAILALATLAWHLILRLNYWRLLMYYYALNAVGMLRKKKYYSKAATISKLTVNSHLLQNYFSQAKMKILKLIGKCPNFRQVV